MPQNEFHSNLDTKIMTISNFCNWIRFKKMFIDILYHKIAMESFHVNLKRKMKYKFFQYLYKLDPDKFLYASFISSSYAPGSYF